MNSRILAFFAILIFTVPTVTMASDPWQQYFYSDQQQTNQSKPTVVDKVIQDVDTAIKAEDEANISFVERNFGPLVAILAVIICMMLRLKGKGLKLNS